MSVPKLSLYALQSLARALAHPMALTGRTIGGPLRERVILRVSSINSCAVCSAVHGAVGRLEGLSANDVREARQPDSDGDLEPRVQAALRYAEVRTAQLEAEFPDVVEAFERELSPQEQTEVRAVADLFTFNNRFNNTWEGWLPGASRRRNRLGLADDHSPS